MEPAETDLYRRRWRRVRQGLKLCDVEDAAFARGDLGARITGLRMRLVVLPSDPEANHLRFDKEFWDWWRQHCPAQDRGAPFGQEVRPTAWAATWYSVTNDTDWTAYLALRRSGTLDVGVGPGCASMWTDFLAFRLVPMVGRCWIALEAYREMVEHLNLVGPFELSLALCDTKGAYLGHFASGWRDLGDPIVRALAAAEAAYLGTWEVHSLAADDVRNWVVTLGSWLEDCWGSTDRRFLPPEAGTLDDFQWQRFR